jgi:hypothetical protein
MLKSRFRIAAGVLVIATLAGSAAAQSPRAPINTLNDLEAALLDCWVPPPIEQSRPGMQITVLMSFKRNGELFGQPRIPFQSSGAHVVPPRWLAAPLCTEERFLLIETKLALQRTVVNLEKAGDFPH